LKTCNLSRVVSLEISPACPSTLSITTGLQSLYKDVSIGSGLYPVHSSFHLPPILQVLPA